MSTTDSSETDDLPPLEAPLLSQSVNGLFYVEDEENGVYEIEAFLGDVTPICQVFLATYTPGGGDVQLVALKLARVDESAEFMKMRQEVENSFKIGPNDDQENNVITDDNLVLGIYKSFNYRNFLCVSMPFMEMGSLRYIISEAIPDQKLPEKLIAVVLREILNALSFLHGRGRVHSKLSAGNIFLGDDLSEAPIKLGYQGSTYFHHPDCEHETKIWERDWDPGLGMVYCLVSNLPWNIFCTANAIYEPNSDDYTPASDIWNLGVTALELVFGPLCPNQGTLLRNRDELRDFLINLHNNQEIGLPKLSEIFFLDPAPVIPFAERVPNSRIAWTARKVKKSLLLARKKMKTFIKKVKRKILNPEPNPDPPEAAQPPNLNLNAASSSFTAMVKRCLALDPNERPTAEMLLHDPFFEEHQDADIPYLLNFF